MAHPAEGCMTEFITGLFHGGFAFRAVLLPFILGLLLRARRLRRKGLFLWDEAAFVRETGVTFRTFEFLFRNFGELRRLRAGADKAAIEDVRKRYVEHAAGDYVYYKPWHMFALRIGTALTRQTDFGAALPSLTFGLAAIAAVWGLGQMAQWPAAGIAGAAVLAVSGLHVLHSRSAEPEPGTALCFTMMLLLSLAHKTALAAGGAHFLWNAQSVALLAGCGVCLGGTMMFNPAWIALTPPVFIAGEVVYGLAAGSGAAAIAVSLGAPLAAAAATVVITDIPFMLCAKLIPGIKIVPHTVKLYQLALRLFTAFTQRRADESATAQDELGVALPRFYHLRFYPELLRHTEGAAVLVAAGAGLVVTAARFTPAGLMLGAQLAIILGMLVVVPLKAARACVFWLPLLCLFAGAGLAAAPAWLGLPALAWILVRGSVYCWKIGNMTSAMRLAAEFVRARGETAFASTSAPFTLLYGEKTPIAPRDYAFICHLYHEQKTRFMAIDHHQHFPGMKWDETQELIQNHCRPVFEVEDPCATFFPLRMEVELYTRRGVYEQGPVEVAPWNRFRMAPSEADRRVRVYDLNEFFTRLESPGIIEYISLYMARDLCEKSRFEEALKFLRLAEKNGLREDSRVKYFTALCHAQLGKEEWAARGMKKLAEDPAARPEVRDSAQVFLHMKAINEAVRALRFEDALEDIKKVLDIKPRQTVAMLYEAVCIFHLRGADAARPVFTKLLRDPAYPDSHKDTLREFALQHQIVN